MSILKRVLSLLEFFKKTGLPYVRIFLFFVFYAWETQKKKNQKSKNNLNASNPTKSNFIFAKVTQRNVFIVNSHSTSMNLKKKENIENFLMLR